MMIDAASMAVDSGARLNLDIYGSGSDEYVNTLRARIERNRATDIISLHGPLDNSRVAETYRRGHIGLALYEPSQDNNDSLSNKLLEVVSSGRPVLAGNLTENRRFIEKYDVGILVDVNVESLCAELIKLAQEKPSTEWAAHCFEVGQAELVWEQNFEAVLTRVRSSTVTAARG
ncbi:hypothetical protein GCM10009737_16850 [Nocardioides lentus]|uniref:Glycosyltransferase n=2 Tax=Nocardioides lentus TaxID=338077 RepID=A0ABP5AKD4_9ACTN